MDILSGDFYNIGISVLLNSLKVMKKMFCIIHLKSYFNTFYETMCDLTDSHHPLL